jgi:hypothetical protein
MKTAKVTKVTIKPRDWQYGKMYSHEMELDNWEKIKLNKKKDNQFKVGDTVNYEENGEWKRKEVKEDAPKKPQWNQESQNRGAMVGMCIKLAFEKLYQWEDDFQKAATLSQRLFDLAMDMYTGQEKSEYKIEDSTENDDLPF